MKSRSHAFDLLCGICILRMITLHVMTYCGFATLSWWETTMQWSYFFMSFFFFKAGYFNKRIDGDSLQYVIDKTRRLLVPYFSWGILATAVFFGFVWFVLPSNNPIVTSVDWNHVWRTSCFFGNPPLWFLLSFYFSYLVVHFLSKIPPVSINKIKISWSWLVVVFPLLSYVSYRYDNPLPLNLGNVFFGAFLFWLGKLWRRVVDGYSRICTVLISLLMTAVFVVLNATEGGNYQMCDNVWTGNFFVLIVAIPCVLCGISGLLLSFKMPRIPILGYIGQHSMVYFVSHYVVLMFFKLVRSSCGHSLRGQWDDFTLIYVFVFVICTLLVPYVERVSWLSGRYTDKSSKLWII